MNHNMPIDDALDDLKIDPNAPKIIDIPKEADFEIPEAPEFSKYLRENIEGKLGIENKDYMGNWEITVDDEKIGTYIIIKIGNKKVRTYSGKIPGYINLATDDDNIALTTINGIGRQDKHKIPFP
jgi:hypothetical protein